MSTSKKKHSNFRRLATHVNVCTNTRPFVCDICGDGFFQKAELKTHEWTHTEEAAQEKTQFFYKIQIQF